GGCGQQPPAVVRVVTWRTEVAGSGLETGLDGLRGRVGAEQLLADDQSGRGGDVRHCHRGALVSAWQAELARARSPEGVLVDVATGILQRVAVGVAVDYRVLPAAGGADVEPRPRRLAPGEARVRRHRRDADRLHRAGRVL